MAKTRFLSILSRILKYFGIALAILFFLFGIVSWVVVKKKNDWLLEQIQSYMNESQSGQLEIGSIDFKLFRSFPDVSIELDSIDYYEHRDSLRAPEDQPILHANQLFVALKLFPLMGEELIVSEISLSHARLNIRESKSGILNIQRALANPAKAKVKTSQKKNTSKPPVSTSSVKEKTTRPKIPAAKPGIQIDLQLIDLSDILVTWKPYASPKSSVLLIKEVKADLVKDKNIVTAKLTSIHQIKTLTIKSIGLPPGNFTFSTDLRYEVDKQLLRVQESEIKYNEFTATLQGSYAHQENQMLDVQVDASTNDMEFLSIFVKPEVIKQNPNLLKEGDIYVRGRVYGELKKQSPQFDISFGVKDLDLELPKKLGTFRNLGCKGNFTSGSLPDYSEAKFEINDLSGQLPGGFLNGRLHIHNFVEPYLSYKLNAQLKLDGYDEIFRINFLRNLTGTVSLQANFDGPLKMFDKHQMDSSRSSVIALNNLSFVVTKTNQLVSGFSGKMETRYNQTTIHNLALNYGKNDLHIEATIDNLMHLIFKKENDISVAAHVQSNVLFTKDFIPDTLLSAHVQDKISNLSFDFEAKTSANKLNDNSGFPDITFDIRNLTFRLDELPDLKKVDAKGQLSDTHDGLKLDLYEFHATMPYGKLDVVGDLLIPQKKLWQFDAKVKATKFPWTYVKELIAEIKEGQEPTAKNLPAKEMEIVTADIDLSASIITFPFDITKLNVRNSRIDFSFPNSKPITVDKLDLDLENLYFKHPKNSGAITGLKSTKGTIEMKQLGVPGLKKFDISINTTGKDDLLDIEFSSATQKAKSEKGKLSLNMTGKEPQYHLHFAVQQANLENYIKKYYKKKLMAGDINYLLDLHAAGSSWASVKESLKGEIVITGDSLKLYGVDIDKVLRKYEKSQNFNLTDLGAVLIAGPIGLAVTKGTDFVSLAAINLDSTQRTMIQTLVAKWKLENRQLITQDVALATMQNRIAFNGRIDFATDSIPGLTIAVIDKQGCSLMDQKLYGKIGKLKTGKLNVTKTLFGSVINFVNAVVGKDCKPVYVGTVQNPLR